MSHPLLNLFGFEGTNDISTSLHYPRGGRGREFCKPCKRSFGDPDFSEIQATLSQIGEGHFYEGSEEVEIGPDWPEIISVTIEPPLVRSDVVDIMTESGITGFTPHRVDLTIEDEGALSRPIPDYCQIEITGKIDISYPEDEDDIVICPVCLSRTDRKWGTKIMYPNMDSWSGHDLVRTANVASAYRFSTPKLIDLARAEKWEAFHFGSWIPNCRVDFMKHQDWLADTEEHARSRFPKLF